MKPYYDDEEDIYEADGFEYSIDENGYITVYNPLDGNRFESNVTDPDMAIEMAQSIAGFQQPEEQMYFGDFMEPEDLRLLTNNRKETKRNAKLAKQYLQSTRHLLKLKGETQKLSPKVKLNIEKDIMGKFPIFRNGGTVKFLPGGRTRIIKTSKTPKGHYRSFRIQDPTNRYAITRYVGGDNNQDTIYVHEYPTQRYIGGEPYEDVGFYYPAANRKISKKEAMKNFIYPSEVSSDRNYYEKLQNWFNNNNPYGD